MFSYFEIDRDVLLCCLEETSYGIQKKLMCEC